MGLDMYLTGEKFVMNRNLEEDGFRLRSKTLELGYWRKHPNLHGYIAQSFAGGKDQCQDIHLGAPERIRTIIAAVQTRELPCPPPEGPRPGCASIFASAEKTKRLQTDEPGIFRSVTYRASW